MTAHHFRHGKQLSVAMNGHAELHSPPVADGVQPNPVQPRPPSKPSHAPRHRGQPATSRCPAQTQSSFQGLQHSALPPTYA